MKYRVLFLSCENIRKKSLKWNNALVRIYDILHDMEIPQVDDFSRRYVIILLLSVFLCPLKGSAVIAKRGVHCPLSNEWIIAVDTYGHVQSF